MGRKEPAFDLSEIAEVHNQATTLYHSVGHVIRSKIQSGEWEVGQQIPSERSILQMLNISRSTVRQGLEFLVREGVLHRVQGKGTFVAPAKIRKSALRLLEFSDVIRENGLTPNVVLLGHKLIDPPADIQAKLAFADGEQTVWLQRLLLVNDSPMLIETAHFSGACHSDAPGAYDEAKGLRELLAECGVHVFRAQETFEPVILEDEEARLLGVSGGSPGLWVESLAFGASNTPVAFVTSLFRGDRCRFYSDLTFT
jgi:GntR family transcriptional regulator